MKKYVKVTSILLFTMIVMLCTCIFASAEEYGVWVGGVQVTDENSSDVLGNIDVGATVTYDEATNTLFLKNAVIAQFVNQDDSNCGIYSNSSLNVVVEGDNRIDVFPDETNADEFAIAIKAKGNITITSAEKATLTLNAGLATRENFGFYIVGGGIEVSGGVQLDINLSDITVTCEFGEGYEPFGNSIGIHCEHSAYFKDNVSIECVTGNIFISENLEFEGTLEDINSGGSTVGIAVYGDLVFDTAGVLHFYINDSDGKRAGIASFSNFELKRGSIEVEMAPSKGEYLLAGPAVYLTLTDDCPCIPLCGADKEELVTGKVSSTNMGGYPLRYYTGETGSLPAYTMLVTAVLGIPEIETDSSGESTVTVSVEDEETIQNAFVVFSAYNSQGKMTDIRFKNGNEAVDGKLDASLDLSEASCAMIFVFESVNSMKPVAHKLIITDFT